MVPYVSQFVLKVHSRCDLSCDYCYVYNHADQSWRIKPRALSEETARRAAARIAEHAVSHCLDEVHVVLHGGEPLLLGHDRLGRVLKILRSAIEPVSSLDLRIQTNGVLLNERLCALFAEHRVQVGVSLDGDHVATERHRRFPDGRSSHEPVLRALALLRRPQNRALYAGILCTVDLANDPLMVYEALLAQEPPSFDLLLPHATWDQPPPRPDGGMAAYGAWLGQIYARWMADGRPVPIRLFDSLRSAWAGHGSETEAVGLDPVDLLVIDTDGAWEQADSLKTAFDGAPATNLNVFSHSVDQAAAHPGVSIRLAGLAGLCSTCRACPVVQACGGGLYAHRYKHSNGFANPSVYCDDLKTLAYRVAAGQKEPVRRPAVDSGSTRRHMLSPAAFDLLAAGPGDTAAMVTLSDAQWSLSRALVAAVAARLDVGGGDLARAAIEGWTLLTRLDAERPAAVREILSYPYVQAWALQCLRPGNRADPELLRAHLAGLAAAAALRAGVEAELVLPVREGFIHLPTHGALAVTTAAPTAVVRLSPTRIACAADLRGWQTIRRISVPGLSVTVDDVDPFRDCQVWPATRRLPEGTWRSWRLALAAAAQRLASTVPAYAAVISGLRSLMPMALQSAASNRSATARHAFGALALVLPGDVDTLCELLLHEMQHMKLVAVADMYDLYDPSDDRLHPVPWRPDPRPAEGVLHGTYAHLAIAEFWRARAGQSPAGRAGRLSMTYQGWVAEGLDTLLRARVLTAEGERFAGGMRATVEEWADAR